MIPSTASVLAGTDQPEEAAALHAFLLTEEAQGYFAEETFEYPLVDGVPPVGAAPLDACAPPDYDADAARRGLEGTARLIAESGLDVASSGRAGRAAGDHRASATCRGRRFAGLFATPLAIPGRRRAAAAGRTLAASDPGAIDPLARTLLLGRLAWPPRSAALGTAVAWLVARTDLPGQPGWAACCCRCRW